MRRVSCLSGERPCPADLACFLHKTIDGMKFGTTTRARRQLAGAQNRMQNDGTAIDAAMGTDGLPGRDVLDKATLQALSERSDAPGVRHLAGHGAIILATGWLLSQAYASGMILLIAPALVLY